MTKSWVLENKKTVFCKAWVLATSVILYPTTSFGVEPLVVQLPPSWIEVCAVFALLVAINSFSLMLIEAVRRTVRHFRRPEREARESNLAAIGESWANKSNGRAPNAAVAQQNGNGANAEKASHGIAKPPSRLRLPIDTDSFQPWQSIKRNGLQKRVKLEFSKDELKALEKLGLSESAVRAEVDRAYQEMKQEIDTALQSDVSRLERDRLTFRDNEIQAAYTKLVAHFDREVTTV